MTTAEVQTVPLCMRAASLELLTVTELERAYWTLRRAIVQRALNSDITVLAAAAEVLEDFLSMQEG